MRGYAPPSRLQALGSNATEPDARLVRFSEGAGKRKKGMSAANRTPRPQARIEDHNWGPAKAREWKHSQRQVR